MKVISLTILLLSVFLSSVTCQEKVLLKEKQGTFRIVKNSLNGQGPDLYNKPCACTDTESGEALEELGRLVSIIMDCPVLKSNRGFDGICDLSGGRCSSKFGYGVPSTVAFYLRTWSLNKGKETQWTIEPPQWRFEVNMNDRFTSNGFNESNFSNAYNATNPAFSSEGENRAALALNELFYQPGIREIVRPGIDRYGDNVVIYNPNRPLYWQQVTIRELFRLMIDYWSRVPDKAQTDAMLPILTSELNNFRESEKDGYAYLGNPETISRVSSVKNDTPVLRPNPDYWNRNLPKSAIQLIIMEIPGKEYLRNKKEGSLKLGDGYYYIYKLLEELDINEIASVITGQGQ